MPITRDDISPVQFHAMHEALLKTTEKAKPFGKLRELANRIKTGEAKLAAAEKKGIGPNDLAYLAAKAKLDGLRAEAQELKRTHQIPHSALAMVHHFLRASEGWGLPAGSYVSVRLPGIFDVKVDVSNEEAPF